jgi:hypothetical protein
MFCNVRTKILFQYDLDSDSTKDEHYVVVRQDINLEHTGENAKEHAKSL